MPIQTCRVNGKRAYRWGKSGKCYRKRSQAVAQARAAYANGYTGNLGNVEAYFLTAPLAHSSQPWLGADGKPVSTQTPIRPGRSLKTNRGKPGSPKVSRGKPSSPGKPPPRKLVKPSVLRLDPTKSATLRREFNAELTRRFRMLKQRLRQLVVVEDAFGLKPVSMNPFVGNATSLVSPLANAFCPTGKGGGIDPTCSGGGEKLSITPDAEGNYGFYHGTSTSHLDSIMRDGLKVSKGVQRSFQSEPGSKNFYEGPRGERVYVTSDYEAAQNYAETRSREVGGDPVMLLYHVPKKAFDSFTKDTEDDRGAFGTKELKREWMEWAVKLDIYGDGYDDKTLYEKGNRYRKPVPYKPVGNEQTRKLYVVVFVNPFAQNSAGSNCGIGPGGFQPGNKCAAGGGSVAARFADMPIGKATSKEAKQWRKRHQKDYDNDKEFQAVVDGVTAYAQGGYHIVRAYTEKAATGKMSSYYKDNEAHWETLPGISGDYMSAHDKTYFEGQAAEGDKRIRYSRAEVGRAITKAIHESPPINKPLYRGDLSYIAARKALELKPGDPFELTGATSFTTDGDFAEKWSRGQASGQRKERKPRREGLVIEVVNGAKGLPIAALSPWDQKEVLTSGKFIVKEVRKIHDQRAHIVLEQISTYEPVSLTSNLRAVGVEESELVRLITKQASPFPLDPARNSQGSANSVTANTRWKFLNLPQKVEAFRSWLSAQVKLLIVPDPTPGLGQDYWERYAVKGYEKGLGRSYDDVNRKSAINRNDLAYHESSKVQFLRSFTVADKLVGNCGGPGSGVPGPCPKGGGKASGIEDGKLTRSLAKKLTEELRQQGIDIMHPVMGILARTGRGLRISVTRSEGKVTGVLTYSVDKVSKQVTLDQIRALTERKGVGTELLSSVAKKAAARDYEMAGYGVVATAVPFYQKLGGEIAQVRAYNHPDAPMKYSSYVRLPREAVKKLAGLVGNVYCATGPGGGVKPDCKLGPDQGGSYGGQGEFGFAKDYLKPKPLKTELEGLRKDFAKAAQEEYDEWEGDNDPEIGAGGICDRVSSKIARIIASKVHDVELYDGGAEGDDHAWTIARVGAKAYAVDIPPGVYETGGGYVWHKIPGVKIKPSDIEIWDVSNYLDDLVGNFAGLSARVQAARISRGEKIKLLSDRMYHDFANTTDQMRTAIERTLIDGMTTGQTPDQLATALEKNVDGLGLARAKMIATTELTRSHAEGQLDALDELGVAKVNILAEWRTAGDGRVCPMCRAMEGSDLTIAEARGLIPRHPGCRCAFMPALYSAGGRSKSQKRKTQTALGKSLRAETGDRTIKAAKRNSGWAGKGVRNATRNVFCPTGPGGGVKPDCKLGSKGPVGGEGDSRRINMFEILDKLEERNYTKVEGKKAAFHGTALAHLKDILKNGINPAQSVKSYTEDYYKGDRAESVFVSPYKGVAKEYAQNRAKKLGKGTPVVIELSIPQSEYSKFTPDERHIGFSMRRKGRIPPEWISKVTDADGKTVDLSSLSENLATKKFYVGIVLGDPELIENVFCPTGIGGGIDPSCGSSSSGLGRTFDKETGTWRTTPPKQQPAKKPGESLVKHWKEAEERSEFAQGAEVRINPGRRTVDKMLKQTGAQVKGIYDHRTGDFYMWADDVEQAHHEGVGGHFRIDIDTPTTVTFTIARRSPSSGPTKLMTIWDEHRRKHPERAVREFANQVGLDLVDNVTWNCGGKGGIPGPCPDPASKSSLGSKLKGVGKAVVKTAFASYRAGQILAERISKERGYTKEQSGKLRGLLSAMDLVASKPVAIGLTATGVGAGFGAASGFVPTASLGYIAYSTARNPKATVRAARGLVRDALQRGIFKSITGNRLVTPHNSMLIADALEKHKFDDWYIALLSVAIEETGSLELSTRISDKLYSTTQNVFCSTGKGGGIDPTCAPDKGGTYGGSGKEFVWLGKGGYYPQRPKTPKVGYHVTSVEHLESISKKGLIPQVSTTGGGAGNKPKAIYMADSLQEGHAEGQVTLRVKVPKKAKAYDDTEVREYNGTKGISADKTSAFLITEAVPAKDIEVSVVKDGKRTWTPLQKYSIPKKIQESQDSHFDHQKVLEQQLEELKSNPNKQYAKEMAKRLKEQLDLLGNVFCATGKGGGIDPSCGGGGALRTTGSVPSGGTTLSRDDKQRLRRRQRRAAARAARRGREGIGRTETTEGVRFRSSGIGSGAGSDTLNKARLAEVVKQLRTHNLTLKDVGNMAGALDGATVSLRMYSDYNGRPKVEASVSHADYHAERGIYPVEGKIYNSSLRVNNSAQGSGIGTKIFATQVQAGIKAGFKSINTYAAKGSSYNGFYTWPRLGYDAPLPGSVREKLVVGKLLKDAEKFSRISDVMKSKEGRDWWKANGTQGNMEFDLSPGSLSRQVLGAYARAKGIANDIDKGFRKQGEGAGRRVGAGRGAGRGAGEDPKRRAQRLARRRARRMARIARKSSAVAIANTLGYTSLNHYPWIPLDVYNSAAGANCGIGAGGFQPGNTCAKGGGATTPTGTATGATGVKPPKPTRIEESEYHEKFVRKHFGLEPEDVIELTGALPGALVRWGMTGGIEGGDAVVEVHVEHKEYEATYQMYPDHLQIEYMRSYKTGGGLGAKVLGNQIDAAIDRGMDNIVLVAARNDNPDPMKRMNGYHSWPRYGFDSEIENAAISSGQLDTYNEKRRKAPPEIQGILNTKHARISDLMKSKQGREWWKENGFSNVSSFDLSEDSLSRRVWDAYRAEKESRGVGHNARGRRDPRFDLGSNRGGGPSQTSPARAKYHWVSLETNVFCATGEGGGVKATCSPIFGGAKPFAYKAGDVSRPRRLRKDARAKWYAKQRTKRFAKRFGMPGNPLTTPATNDLWVPVFNAFCPTGKGGGIDPTCSPGSGGKAPGGSGGKAPSLDGSAEALKKQIHDLAKSDEIQLTIKKFFPDEDQTLIVPHGDRRPSDLVVTESVFDMSVKAASAIELGSRMKMAGLEYKEASAFLSHATKSEAYYDLFWEMDDNKRKDTWERVAAVLLSSWADSSGNNDVSIAMQQKAKEVFHIDNTFDRRVSPGGRVVMEDHSKVIEIGLKAIYDRAQQKMEEAGVPEVVTLYRGSSSPKGTLVKRSPGSPGEPEPEAHEVYPDRPVKLQPLSSFSRSYDIAAQFSTGQGDDAGVMAINVPRSKIFSVPGTGFGCLHENEYVVMGGDYNARVYGRNRGEPLTKEKFWESSP